MKITLFILQKGHEFQVRCGIGWTRVDQEWTRADQGGLRRTRADQGGLGGPRQTRLAKGGLGQPRAAQGGPGWTRADQGGLGRPSQTRMDQGGLEGIYKGQWGFLSKWLSLTLSCQKCILILKICPMLSQGDRVLESGPKKIKTTHLNKRHMRLQFIDCNQNLKVYLELVLVWPPRPPKAALVCPSPPLGHPWPTLFHI